MRTFHHTCGSCGTWLDTPLADASVRTACKNCSAEIRAEVFPALFRPAAPAMRGEDVLTSEESACFYHPAKKAVAACESCGRFLCSLCDVDFGGKHLCPRCIEAGAAKGKMETLKNDITHFDSIAVTVALAGLLIFYFSFITAPVAIYLSLRYWNTPQSVLPRGRWRFAAAIILALASLALMAFIIGSIILKA